MAKRKNFDAENEDSDDEYDSDSCKKYEILKEDDIEGQEAGLPMNDGNVQITPFNMKEELEEGHFDSEGMYHWNKTIKDNWVDDIDWIKIKETNTELKQQLDSESEDDVEFNSQKLYEQMLNFMNKNETVATALRRLGGSKSLSASERLKRKKSGLPFKSNDTNNQESFTKLTELADAILRKGNMSIYQETYDDIFNKVNRKNSNKKSMNYTANSELDMYADDFNEKESKKINVASTSKQNSEVSTNKDSYEDEENNIQWELVQDINSDNIEGPYSTEQMNKFILDNHFKKDIWVRKVGSDSFYSSRRIDFELYLH